MPNQTLTIINQSGFDVEVVQVTAPEGSDGLDTYTPVGSVSNSATLQVSASDGLYLARFTGAFADLNQMFYEQFPIARWTADNATPSTWSQTLTTAGRSAMVQAFLFIRYMMANNNSVLAEQFTTALTSATPETAVNTFFARTANFRSATYNAYQTILNWQQENLSPWQGQYFLYSTDPNDSTLKAFVQITASSAGCTGNLWLADPSGNYNIQSTPVGLAPVGQGSIQESSPGGQAISMNLKPTWINLPGINSQGLATNAICAAFKGVLNGAQVYGLGQKRPKVSGGNQPTEASSRTVASEVAGIVGGVVALIALGVTIFQVYLQIKRNSNRADPTQQGDTVELTPLRSAARALTAAQAGIRSATDALQAWEVSTSAMRALSQGLLIAPPSEATQALISRMLEAQKELENSRPREAVTILSGVARELTQMISGSASALTDQQKETLATAQKSLMSSIALTESVAVAEADAAANRAAPVAEPVSSEILAPVEEDPFNLL